MRYRVIAFEKFMRAGTDFTKSVAGERVGVLLQPICDCPDCTTECASHNSLAGEQRDDDKVGADDG
jgi:hypothetical protein